MKKVFALTIGNPISMRQALSLKERLLLDGYDMVDYYHLTDGNSGFKSYGNFIFSGGNKLGDVIEASLASDGLTNNDIIVVINNLYGTSEIMEATEIMSEEGIPYINF